MRSGCSRERSPSVSPPQPSPTRLGETQLAALARTLETALARPLILQSGRVVEIAPTYLRVKGLAHCVNLGDWVRLGGAGAANLGEVIHIAGDSATVKPFQMDVPVSLQTRVSTFGPSTIAPSPAWKGRAVNALALPIDGIGHLQPGERQCRLDLTAPDALQRQRVLAPVRTGVRAVDIFTPICTGQRIGIFAGSGVGKSTLLSLLVQGAEVDCIVVALVGERGREVREFLEDTLGPRRPQSVAVVSTSDESPMMRRLAPQTAMTIAEYFRDRGERVLLVVDSITRYAHALRDVALAAGEPPVARGYTPSVYSSLARYLERAGPGAQGTGSITGLISVLIDGDDHNDPVADSVRGIVDGHIVLDRRIAEQGRFPAINLTSSVSRLATAIWTPEQQKVAIRLRGMIARYEESSDLRLIGGYHPGTDAELDRAVQLVPRLYEFLKQGRDAPSRTTDPFVELAKALS